MYIYSYGKDSTAFSRVNIVCVRRYGKQSMAFSRVRSWAGYAPSVREILPVIESSLLNLSPNYCPKVRMRTHLLLPRRVLGDRWLVTQNAFSDMSFKFIYSCNLQILSDLIGCSFQNHYWRQLVIINIIANMIGTPNG